MEAELHAEVHEGMAGEAEGYLIVDGQSDWLAPIPHKRTKARARRDPVHGVLWRCKECGQWKPGDAYSWRNRAGRKPEPRIRCKPCRNARSVKYRAKQRRSGVEGLITNRLRDVRARAKHLGMTFDLDLPYLLDLYVKQGGLCRWTGKRMDIETGSKDIVSVDRIDSSKGYEKGNVCLCTRRINVMKSDMDAEEFQRICGLVFARSDRGGVR